MEAQIYKKMENLKENAEVTVEAKKVLGLFKGKTLKEIRKILRLSIELAEENAILS